MYFSASAAAESDHILPGPFGVKVAGRIIELHGEPGKTVTKVVAKARISDYEAVLPRVDASTQFSPWISLANNLQYDTVSRLLGWQLRFRWIQRPGNDLYVVYTHNWHEVLDVARRRLATLDNRLATKLVYTLRF